MLCIMPLGGVTDLKHKSFVMDILRIILYLDLGQVDTADLN